MSSTDSLPPALSSMWRAVKRGYYAEPWLMSVAVGLSVLDHMYWSLFTTCGWMLRLAVTVGVLASVHPALIGLAVFALPTVLVSTWRPPIERAAEERGAPASRLAKHLFDLATTAAPGK